MVLGRKGYFGGKWKVEGGKTGRDRERERWD